MTTAERTREQHATATREQVLTNARIVTQTDEFTGCVRLKDGCIADIDDSQSQLPGAQDCHGRYLIPGLVELHTDNLEKHFSPRPGVVWPSQPAVITHDAHIVSSGITTVFDALSVGDVATESTRIKHLQTLLDALAATHKNDLLRAQHLLHLRCEVSHPDTLGLFRELVDHPLLQLVSVMDHTPGQRQFVNEDKYHEYYKGKYGMSTEQMEVFTRERKEAARLYSDSNRQAIVSICQQRNIPLASHDDATREHVAESASFGMTIAEFPTTLEAARASHEQGLAVLMGAPNIVRGGSHSGNIAAAELAREGVLDILSSDYYPASMLDAAFRVAAMDDNDYNLPQAIATVTATPARCARLDDRGTIERGKRADLVLVGLREQLPVIDTVWSKGQRVY